MNNDGTNFFNFAIAVAVACNADTRPKGETKPEAAAQYIQNVLDMAFVNTGLKFRVKPLAYPQCGKIPIVIQVPGRGVCLLWYYPYMKTHDLTLELEGVLHTVLTEALCETA